MKKKIFILLAAVMVFGLAVAVYAYNSTALDTGKAKTSCCSGDSCPMKKAAAKTGEKSSCCDDCACCKDGVCPMKSGEAVKAGHADSHKMADGESCPMMKDGAHKMSAGHEAKDGHADCSCSCSCCGSKEKKADTTV